MEHHIINNYEHIENVQQMWFDGEVWSRSYEPQHGSVHLLWLLREFVASKEEKLSDIEISMTSLIIKYGNETVACSSVVFTDTDNNGAGPTSAPAPPSI